MGNDTPENSWRDERGRFGPGNPGGPGGGRRRPNFRRAIEEAVSADHAAAVMRKATMMAIGGNVKAAELVLNHLGGRPAEAPESAEVLDFTIQDLNSIDACREAIETVIKNITQGRVNRKTGQFLVASIRDCLAALEKKQREQALLPPKEATPIPGNVLRALFRRFRRVGELPESVPEAAAVIAKVKEGVQLVPCEGLIPGISTDEFAPKARPDDPAMDTLLDEAVYGTGLVWVIARHYLRGFAQIGRDVTAAQLQYMLPPEFGSVGTVLFGFPERLARKPYTKQVRRLIARMEALKERMPKTPKPYFAWRDEVNHAMVALQFSGELPRREDVVEAVLVSGEFSALLDHFLGEDVSKEMRLFDTIAQSTGDAKKAALDELAALARSGHFDGGNQVAAPEG